MPPKQAILSYSSAINPLAGLSSAALRLYGALEVFREAYRSPKMQEWFRAPQLDKRLQQIGFSKTKIDKGFAELVSVGVLQVQMQHDTQWLRLK